ncbi:hypothetical protein ACCS91_39705, partial [Rhizobium ruizarguesonis]
PVGKPIQYRVSCENLQTVRELAQKLGSIVGAHPSLSNLAFNWNEPARVVKIDVGGGPREIVARFQPCNHHLDGDHGVVD